MIWYVIVQIKHNQTHVYWHAWGRCNVLISLIWIKEPCHVRIKNINHDWRIQIGLLFIQIVPTKTISKKNVLIIKFWVKMLHCTSNTIMCLIKEFTLYKPCNYKIMGIIIHVKLKYIVYCDPHVDETCFTDLCSLKK